MKTLFLTLVLALSLFTASAQTVDADTFEKGLHQHTQLLDVRTPEEFEQGHLKNAMLANWNDKAEFDRRVAAMDKDKPVYIYCLGGGRSTAATKALKEKGFTSVIELKGGINAWRQAEKPEEGTAEVVQISEEAYAGMLQSAKLVLVDFGASWCPPCRKMEPVLTAIEKQYAPEIPLIKIDGGSQKDLMKAHGVQEMPTFVVYKNGKEVWRKAGMMKQQELSQVLDKFRSK